MIQAKGITKKYDGFTAIENLDLNVAKGSIYGLIGINGSGKTTLIKQLTGILRPDAGEITIGGEPVYDNVSVKMKTAYVPDELYFPSNYTLDSMASFYRGVYHGRWDQQRFDAMCDDFGLSRTNRISRFSKGMQKQAAFILAMSITPDYLILDEPVDGLDPIMRKKLWSYILGDVADRQLTVLISSHNLRELEGICDCIGILKNKRIQFEGRLDQLQSELEGMTLEEIFLHEMEVR